MVQDLMPLSSFSSNTYSQFGEDGIIEEILRRIETKHRLSKYCVEFGAWDGIHLSNCARLIKEESYSAILIEADKRKFKDLVANFPQESVLKICAFVDTEANSIDRIVNDLGVDRDIDIISIDIDGNDYWILKSLKQTLPKVVVVEYNPTIPNSVDFFQVSDSSRKIGSSAKALSRLALSMGYHLVALTHCNLIFVRSEFLSVVLGRDKGFNIDELRDDQEFRHYVFVGYDGTVFLDSTFRIYWHETYLSQEGLQFLPRFFRKFPTDFTRTQKLLWRIYKKLLEFRNLILVK